MDDEGRLTTDDGVSLYYRVVGEGDTVLVPGAVTDEDLEPLAEGRRVIFYDSRNRGRSDSVDEPARLGFYREVDDLELVRSHFELDQVTLLGWSYNAAVCAYYAMTRTDRVTHLVLVSPVAPRSDLELAPIPPPEPHLLAHLDQLQADGLAARDPEAFCREWRNVYVPILMGDPAAFARLRSDPCSCSNERPDRLPRSLAHVFLDLGFYDWRGDLERLMTPTLVVHGDADQIPVLSAHEWVEALPTARLILLPSVGHFPWAEAGRPFFDAVDTFLRGAWPEG